MRTGSLPCAPSTCSSTTHASFPPALRRHHQRRWAARPVPASAAGGSAGGGEGSELQGSGSGSSLDLNLINRNNMMRPAGPQPPVPSGKAGMGYELMGEEGYTRFVEGRKAERQRVWNVMRQAASERLARGEMPSWFNPHWLTQEEAPVNTLMREMGDELYQDDPAQPLEGGGGDDGSGHMGGGGRGWWNRGGGGWWREDDPYWMLRDWGDHPMRWWTLGSAALFAVGGLLSYASNGSIESLFWGWGTGAWLSLCSLAMSDMTSEVQPHGELGVKAAWGACALMGLKDGVMGWEHRPTAATYRSAEELLEGERDPMPWDFLVPKLPRLQMGACGIASAAMCVAYMVTGMSGLEWHALPENPGSVYKSQDIVYKHYVWKKWGYAQNSMRL